MIRPSPKLPRFTAHPAFGVAVLLALAVVLIIHGEPQPSSRPSGKTVAIGSASAVPVEPQPVLLIARGQVEWRLRSTVRRIALPAGAKPRQLLTSRGMSVVMAVVDNRQHAFAVSKELAVTDLGLADGIIPAALGTAAILIETSVTQPGKVYQSIPEPSSASTSAASSASSSQHGGGPPPLQNFLARRYDASGRALGSAFELPPGMRLATDSVVGLLVWQPTSRVFDAGVAQESQSALAMLMRPDGTLRTIGPVHPLAATRDDLLVWDVEAHRFGLMPLQYVTSNATTTATPSASESQSKSRSSTPTPSSVAGVKWFDRTKGFVVTGPASFSADSSAFAVYASVGSRRRLVVAQVANVGTDQIEVLALVQPSSKASSSTTPVLTASPTSSSASSSSATSSASKSPPADPTFEPDGFPLPAPQVPLWWGGVAIAVGGEGLVVGYKPGNDQGSALDLGVSDVAAVTAAP
jgi:hypothetical protein